MNEIDKAWEGINPPQNETITSKWYFKKGFEVLQSSVIKTLSDEEWVTQLCMEYGGCSLEYALPLIFKRIQKNLPLMINENSAHEIYRILGKPITPENLKIAYEKGMIRKEQLKDGQTYLGYCRNNTMAMWREKRQMFEYERTKFGAKFFEHIPHPENDIGFDIFVPTQEVK